MSDISDPCRESGQDLASANSGADTGANPAADTGANSAADHGADTAAAPTAAADDGAAPPGDYDPADYRWVPVRRRPRYDGWTEEKQRRFIEVLADTGLVGAAATAVGMTRETAYRLRRSAHGAAFARAWDAARAHAAGLVEDIVFERAFEGVEHNVYDENGEVVCTKRVYNDRLLMFLLRNLKPERYGARAEPRARSAMAAEPLPHPALEGEAAQPAPEPLLPVPLAEPEPEPVPELEASLQAMEPRPPVPPEQLLDSETFESELVLADAADGTLPHFLREQRPAKSAASIEAEARAAEEARGAAAWKKCERREELSRREFADMCRHIDPTQRGERSRKRYR